MLTDVLLGSKFHRGEYTVKDVKDFLRDKGFAVREVENEL
jgi:imidazole glycerol phosphate synthase subunit HisF